MKLTKSIITQTNCGHLIAFQISDEMAREYCVAVLDENYYNESQCQLMHPSLEARDDDGLTKRRGWAVHMDWNSARRLINLEAEEKIEIWGNYRTIYRLHASPAAAIHDARTMADKIVAALQKIPFNEDAATGMH